MSQSFPTVLRVNRIRNLPLTAIEHFGTIFFSQSIFQTCRSVIAGLVWVALAAAASAKLELSSDYQPNASGKVVSDDGTINLSWMEERPASGLSYLLEQSNNPAFTNAHTRYQGPDTSSVLTGLREGHYYFRVREVDAQGSASEWSATLALEVHYLDRTSLIVLLTIGAIVAGSTIAAITLGFLKNR